MLQDIEKDFYTIPEAARILSVSQATIWRWIEAERLPAYRVGPRRIRIKKQDLESVIQPFRPKGAKLKEERARRDIWAGYDPERARQALTQVGRRALLADLRAQR